MATINELLKTHICEEIFQNGYPEDVNGQHPFDFFMEADVECANGVDDSSLGEEFGFEVASEYGFENIRSIRGLMQSMLDDLERLQEKIMLEVIESYSVEHHIGKDEFASDSDFHDFADVRGVTLHRSGTADEYVTFRVLDTQGGAL